MRLLGRLREGGIPAVALVVVVAWALAAVFMLARTVVSAQQIEHRVGLVNEQVTPIDRDLRNVALAGTTGKIAGDIRAAALPLVGKLDRVIAADGGIDASAKSILTNADAINASVQSINTTAKSINTSVASIGSTLGSVNTSAGAINASVHGINDRLSTTLSTALSIRDRVVGINTRAGSVIGAAQGIKSDLDLTLAQLPAINRNAAAIANSPLLLRQADLSELGRLLGVGALQLPAPAPAAPAAPAAPLAPVAPLLAPLAPLVSSLPVTGDTGPLGPVLGGVLGH